MRGALNDIFDILVTTLTDTRLEPDLEDLLWSTVNLYHRATAPVQRDLDRNEDAQRRSQTEQDGSEVRSVELERLIAAERWPDRAPRRAGKRSATTPRSCSPRIPARPGTRARARGSTTGL